MIDIATLPLAGGKNPACSAKRMAGIDRRALAISMLGRVQPVKKLAATHGVSRKFVYHQARKAATALDEAFAGQADDAEVLFYLPVTKEWLRKLILGLVLICHSSFRGVQELLRDLLDCDISIGTVHNVVMDAVEKAKRVNAAEHLVNVRVGAHDEIFQARQPVLVGADADSTYCYLLSLENSRDGDTWALRLMELSDKGLHPDYTVADLPVRSARRQVAARGCAPDRRWHGRIFHAGGMCFTRCWRWGDWRHIWKIAPGARWRPLKTWRRK